MARKSNKTDHVLSLLSNGGKDKAQDKNAGTSGPPVEPEKEKEKEKEESSVSIVHSSSEKKEIAETIKKSLEEELDKMMPEQAPEDKEPEEEKMNRIIKSALMEEDDTKSGPKLCIEPVPVHEKKEREHGPVLEEGREAGAKAAAGESRPEDKTASDETNRQHHILKEEVSESVHKEHIQDVDVPEAQEEEFVFLNVMEVLVKDKVLDYMKQFGNCTCPRCVADTSALALTQLPPKYVVINKETVSPFVNFYTKKFAGQITVEITKACIRVGEVPHHNRD